MPDRSLASSAMSSKKTRAASERFRGGPLIQAKLLYGAVQLDRVSGFGVIVVGVSAV